MKKAEKNAPARTLLRDKAVDSSLIVFAVIVVINLVALFSAVRLISSTSETGVNDTLNAAYGYSIGKYANHILDCVTEDGLNKNFDKSIKKWCKKMGVTVFATYNGNVIYNSTGLEPDEYYKKCDNLLNNSSAHEYTTGLYVTDVGTLAITHDNVNGNKRMVMLSDTSFTFTSIDETAVESMIVYFIILMMLDLLCLIVLMFNKITSSRKFAKNITEPIIRLKHHLDEILDEYYDHEVYYGSNDEIGDMYKAVDRIRIKLKNYKIDQRKIGESKKVLVSSLMHDIATPITRISGCASMIRDGMVTDTNEIKQYSSLIVNNTEDIDVLLKRLGELAKYDDNSIQNHMIPVSIVPLIKRYLGTIEVELSGSDADCVVIDKFDITPVCSVDVRSAKRVLTNIIFNSLKYRKPGEHCHIEITVSKGEDGKCIITFADNGIGVKVGSEAEIFEMFFRGDSARGSEAKGSGLGLFISREIVLSNNGQIWAENSENGLTIFISLPLSNEPPIEWN